MIPEPHETFLRAALDRLKMDHRIAGVAAGGSLITGAMDEFSDLDLVIAVEPASYEAVLAERSTIAGALGPILASFTGEHVGEPRLLICLYGPDPLLHVDLKFVSLVDLAKRVEAAAVAMYRRLRERLRDDGLHVRVDAERAAVAYLAELTKHSKQPDGS